MYTTFDAHFRIFKLYSSVHESMSINVIFMYIDNDAFDCDTLGNIIELISKDMIPGCEDGILH